MTTCLSVIEYVMKTNKLRSIARSILIVKNFAVLIVFMVFRLIPNFRAIN